MEEKNPVLKNISSAKAFDSIIGGILVLIFFLCPLFFTGLVAQTIGFEKITLFYFLVLLGVVAWVTKGVVSGELHFKRTPLDIPILALLITFIISTILSVSPRISLIGHYGNAPKSLAAVIIYILFYYLLVNNLNLKRIKLLFWAFIASASLIAVYSLLQIFGIFVLPFGFTKAISFNPLGSTTGLTMFLTIVLPLLIVGAAQLNEIQPNLKNKIVINIFRVLLIIIGLVSLAIMALLNAFTFWPAALVAVVITLMFFLSKVIKISNTNIIIPIVAFLLIIVLLVLGNFNIVDLKLPTEVGLSRQVSWEVAKANMIKDPIFGSGPSTFDYSFAKYKDSNFNSSLLWNVRFDTPSGIFFELAAGVGALGTLAVVVVLLIALSICFISLIKTSATDMQSILLALFASFITIIIFAALFAINSALVLISLIIAVFGLAIAIAIYPERFTSVALTFRTSPKYALALAAIFLTVSAGVVILFTMGIKMYLADVYAYQASTVSEIDQKIIYLTKANQLAPYRDVYYVSLANNYMARANQEALGAKNQSIIENSLALAIDNGKKAVALTPNNVANSEALALIYENASFYTRGALEWAENLYNKAAELEPASPVPALRLGLINMARANAETDNKTEQEYYINEAIKKYDEALAKKSDFGAALYGKAIAYERLNKPDDAIENLKQAVLSTRDNLDYRFELGRLFFNRGVVQPNLAQNASADITKGESAEEDLSVKPSQATGGTIAMNDDLTNAEQLFLSIVQAYPNHANALYSLALIYQKVGNTDNAKLVVQSLLNTLTDEASIDIVKKQFVGLY